MVAPGNIYTVDVLGDSGNNKGTPSSDGNPLHGDLRYCVGQAIADGQQDTIVFDPAIFDTAASRTITLNTSLVTGPVGFANPYGQTSFIVGASDNITVDGRATPGLVIDGGGATRLFVVEGGGTLALQSLNITGGSAAGGAGGNSQKGGGGGGGAGLGGAVLVDTSTFTANGCAFFNNQADGGNGGSISTSGSGGGGGGGLGSDGNSATGTKGAAGGGAGGQGGKGVANGQGGAGVVGGFGGGGGGGGFGKPIGFPAMGGFGGGQGGEGGGTTTNLGSSSSIAAVGGFGGGLGGPEAGGNPGAGGGGAGLGGAIFSTAGTLTLTNDTFTQNAATGGGAGTGGGTAGAGQGDGAAVFVRNGTLTANFDTFSGNRAKAGDHTGGIASDLYVLSDGSGKQAIATVTNSILGQNGTGTITDFFAGVFNGGTAPNLGSSTHNLVSNNPASPNGLTGIITGPNPNFANVDAGFNGGPTETLALTAASTAALGQATTSTGISVDQRGAASQRCHTRHRRIRIHAACTHDLHGQSGD